MNDPVNPISIPINRAVRVLEGGHKPRVTISIASTETNSLRYKFGSTKPTATTGILLTPGDQLILEDKYNNQVGELWMIGIGGSVSVEVGL